MNKSILYSIFFFITFFLSFIQSGESQVKDNFYYKDLLAALGYSFGVESTLDYISKTYPDLSNAALKFKYDFYSQHRSSLTAIEKIIKDELDVNFSDLKMELLNEPEILKSIKPSYEDSKLYLKNFYEEKIMGEHDIYIDFIKTLLSENPTYKSSPILEFTNGFKSEFQTKNNPKSKGLDMKFNYPKSWNKREGNRPNVITLISSSDKLCSTTFLVSDFLKDTPNVTKEDYHLFKSIEFQREFFEEYYKLNSNIEMIKDLGVEKPFEINFSKTKIDGQPAMFYEAKGQVVSANLTLDVYISGYNVLYENYFILMNSMIYNHNNNLMSSIRKYKPLCNLISSSLVINSKWDNSY